MIGGLKKTTSLLALVAASGLMMGGMALTSAQAADLGGDCCADLEERVAELEATTVRKGNRKVSLTISGQVARVFGWYDDEFGNSEMYSSGNGPSSSNIQFAGSAELVPGWTAGYTLRLVFWDDRNKNVLTEAGRSADINSTKVEADRNFVYLKNDRLGTFVAGQAGAPTDGVANISLAGRDVTGTSNGSDWNKSLIQGFDLEQDDRYQAIAWISPTLHGFTYAVAWADLDEPAAGGGVDAWDMALRYAGEFGPVRIAAGIGATFVDDDQVGDGWNLMGSGAVMHTPTGLNIGVALGKQMDGGLPIAGSAKYSFSTNPVDAGYLNGDEAAFWHIHGGVNRDFTGLGATAIYGEYGQYDYDLAGFDPISMWGLGVVQNFDKAATELFLAYRNWNAENLTPSGVVTDGDVSQIVAGMRIKF